MPPGITRRLPSNCHRVHRTRRPVISLRRETRCKTSGNLAEAFGDYQASLAIRERLAKADPGNAGWQHDLAVSCGRVALIEVQQGGRDDALKAFQRGRNIVLLLMQRSADATLPKDLAWFESQMDISRR